MTAGNNLNIQTVTLPDGTAVPKLGQGTWFMGEQAGNRKQELAALGLGIELGLTLIDTAEMYGEGRAEELIGEAISSYDREELFLVSKVYPHNAGRRKIFASCEASLKRLGVDYLDGYLLHWRGNIPLAETVTCMNELVAQGKIRYWGVSNFDTQDMQELWRIDGGKSCALNQVLYHLNSRGTEYDLQPWLKEHHVPLMAYCPIAHSQSMRRKMTENQLVRHMAREYEITTEQLLLAFVLHQENTIAIPKAASPVHVKENALVLTLQLREEDLVLLSKEFPAPMSKTFLDML
jgi:diketogulonate reductase-like aldo/keto reductase